MSRSTEGLNPMRVCMTVMNDFKRDARVRREAETLAAAGYEVLVLAMTGPDLSNRELMDGFTVHRVQLVTKRWPRSIITRVIKYIEYVIITSHVALAWKAKVYHAHNANTLPIAWLVSRLRGARLVYDAHELETDRNWGSSSLSLPIRKLWALPERLFIGSADAVITVCESIAHELEEIYQIASPYVVRNVPEYRDVSYSIDLHQKIGVDPHIPIILYQGGIQANRGIEQMIEAITLLENGVFVALGDGPRLASVREEVKVKGLENRVFFLGHIPLTDLPSYTASADIGVALIQNACKSYYYSLPNKIFEYIRAGLPVVASDFPEMAKIIRRCEVGAVVDPSDPERIATAIRHILDDTSYYHRLQRNAINASIHLNWEKEAGKLLQLYSVVTD